MKQDVLTAFRDVYHDFRDALVDDVLVGPRREVTLILRPLTWSGGQRDYGAPVAVRFGGIEDFDRVALQFQKLPSLESEIGSLGPDPGWKDRKAGLYRFKFESERRSFEFTFRCRSVAIEDAQNRP